MVQANSDWSNVVNGTTIADDMKTIVGLADFLYPNETGTTTSTAYGSSISTTDDGLTVAVGIPGYSANAGRVYIYRRQNDMLTLVQAITSSSGMATIVYFGRHVVLSGDGSVLLVAETQSTSGSYSANGIVSLYIRGVNGTYVFVRTYLPWTGLAFYIGGQYSRAIALSKDGSTMIVGCEKANGGSGSIQVFTSADNYVTGQAFNYSGSLSSNQLYGHAVAISRDGSVFFVNHGQSASGVFVYRKSGATWVKSAEIPAYFVTRSSALSCSDDGNLLVVGSQSLAVNSSASIWRYNGSSWINEATITNPMATTSTNYGFGLDVAVSGNGKYIAISAPEDNEKPTKTGAVYLYHRVGNNWELLKKIFNHYLTNDINLGYALEFNHDGSCLYIGSIKDGQGSVTKCGTVALYSIHKAKFTATEVSTITPSAITSSSGSLAFGSSTAISDDGKVLVIGCALDDSPTIDAGSCFIYEKVNELWTERQKILAPSQVSGNNFGNGVSVSADGSTIAIGMSGYDMGSISNCGGVYIYVRSGNTWVYHSLLTITIANALFGSGGRVALSGDGQTLAIGANTGLAYIYRLINNVWTLIKTFNVELGYYVDLNHDGNVVVLGNYQYTVSYYPNKGIVYVATYDGSTWNIASLLEPTPNVYDAYGKGVCISSDGTVVAIAYSSDDRYSNNSGSVVVWRNVGGVWTMEARLFPFGKWIGYNSIEYVSMAKNGKFIFFSSMASLSYIWGYEHVDGAWKPSSLIRASDLATNQYFGRSHAVSGDGSEMIAISQVINSYKGRAYCYK